MPHATTGILPVAPALAVLMVDDAHSHLGMVDPLHVCLHVCVPAASVASILAQFRKDQGLTSLPLYVAGVSSGGSFSLKLPSLLTINGVVSEANAVEPSAWPMEEAK